MRFAAAATAARARTRGRRRTVNKRRRCRAQFCDGPTNGREFVIITVVTIVTIFVLVFRRRVRFRWVCCRGGPRRLRRRETAATVSGDSSTAGGNCYYYARRTSPGGGNVSVGSGCADGGVADTVFHRSFDYQAPATACDSWLATTLTRSCDQRHFYLHHCNRRGGSERASRRQGSPC